MRRIGVFAGVFDPIHLGHTEFIKRTIRDKKLDKLYLLVEKNPKYKTCIASFEHRKKMTQLAIEEIKEAEIYGPAAETFPITSTLPRIKAENPDSEPYLLLGDDVAAHIDEWPESAALDGVRLAVADRKLDGEYSGVSSLKIRNRLKDGDTDLPLSEAVLAYCRQNGLY